MIEDQKRGRHENGDRFAVAFGSETSAAAGVIRRGDDLLDIAMVANWRNLAIGQTGTVDGAAYRIVSIAPSDPAKGGQKGMVRIKAERNT